MKNITFFKLKSYYEKENYDCWDPLHELNYNISELSQMKHQGFAYLEFEDKAYELALIDFFKLKMQSMSPSFDEVIQIQDVLLKFNEVNSYDYV